MGSTIFPSVLTLLTTGLVLLGAEIIYVLFGFGVGLIAVGALAMILERIPDVVVMLLMVNLPVETFVVATSRKAITWRGVFLICIGIAVGVPLGSLVLQRGNPLIILTLLGWFLIVFGAVFLVLPEGKRLRWPAWSPPLMGTLSGLLAGMFGTGGPPLILFYRLAGLEKVTFRGNLMAIFLVVTLVRLPTYAVMGLITSERIWSAALMLPPVLIGATIGNRIHLSISEMTFQRLVAVALVLIGLLLLLKG